MSKPLPAGGPYKAAAGLHESLTSAHIDEARRVLSNYCKTSPPLCRKYLNLISEASRLIAITRLEDLLHDVKYEGVDAKIFETIRNVIDFYSAILSGSVAGRGNYVLTKTRRPTVLDSSVLEPGEILLLELPDAVLLAALGYVEVLESNTLKSALLGDGNG